MARRAIGATARDPRRGIGCSFPDSRFRVSACYTTGEPARGDRAVEGVGHVAGRGGERHRIERREREAEGASRVRKIEKGARRHGTPPWTPPGPRKRWV